MHEAGHSKLVLCDNLEAREGSGRGLQGEAGMYTYGRFTLLHDKKPSQYCKVVILQLDK